MQESRYGLRVALPIPYEQAIERVTEALKAEGFGVLTTIDVRETLNKKLGAEFRKYVILGACNPPLAKRALDAELDVGLLLPCNVVVRTTTTGTVVEALDPQIMVGLSDNPELKSVADDAAARLERVLARVAA